MRMAVMSFVALCIALPAAAQVCSAEFTGPQCEQLNNDQGGEGSGGGGSGSTCPYYLCGNAYEGHQSSYVWCEEAQDYVDCVIYYCRYQACVGSNCYPTTGTCSVCPSRTGNNVHISECPRT